MCEREAESAAFQSFAVLGGECTLGVVYLRGPLPQWQFEPCRLCLSVLGLQMNWSLLTCYSLSPGDLGIGQSGIGLFGVGLFGVGLFGVGLFGQLGIGLFGVGLFGHCAVRGWAVWGWAVWGLALWAVRDWGRGLCGWG